MNYFEGEAFLKKVFLDRESRDTSGVISRIGLKYRFMYDRNLGEVMKVNVENLYPCQNLLSERKVKEITESVKSGTELIPPSGIKLGDKVYLLDGHHRAAAQILLGEKEIDVRVLEISEEEYNSECADMHKHQQRMEESYGENGVRKHRVHVYSAEERAKRDAEADKRRKEIRECGGLREYLELKFKAENMI